MQALALLTNIRLGSITNYHRIKIYITGFIFIQVNNIIQEPVLFIERNLGKWLKLKLFVGKVNDTELNGHLQNDNIHLLSWARLRSTFRVESCRL